MNKRTLILIAVAVFASTTAVAIANRSGLRHERSTSLGTTSSRIEQEVVLDPAAVQPGQLLQDQPASNAEGSDVPTHVVYGLLFREISAFKQEGERRRAQGKDDSSLRNYHREKANLNDDQATALERIAENCQREVDDLEREAKQIIDADRALHPGGRLQVGEQLPKPPKRLKQLEDKRTDAILKAREKLRAAFGESEFRRFDDFQQQDAANRAKRVEHIPHNSGNRSPKK